MPAWHLALGNTPVKSPASKREPILGLDRDQSSPVLGLAVNPTKVQMLVLNKHLN